MNEIIYRAKRKLNGKWVYGSLVKGQSEDWDYIIPINEDLEDGLDFMKIRVISNTIGFYSNINDVKNEKIFSGDIIQYTQHYFNTNKTNVKTKVVTYINGAWNIYNTNAGESNVLVIGNIYDNG